MTEEANPSHSALENIIIGDLQGRHGLVHILVQTMVLHCFGTQAITPLPALN